MLFSRRVAGAIALSALACGARTNLGGGATSTNDGGEDASASFPVGTYTHCAFGTVAAGPFLIPSGFTGGATLTVTENGDQRIATYDDGNGTPFAWTFDTTTSVSAELAPSAQSTAGFGRSICVYGVGVSNEKFFPTTSNATSGALTYASGTVFVSLDGTLTSQTDCGDVSAPATTWITCTNGPAPDIGAPSSSSAFASGDYTCRSQVGTHEILDGENAFITSGASGSLTLTQSGSHVTAKYTGDTELTGTLDVALDTATTGTSSANQTLSSRCGLESDMGTFDITSTSLTSEGASVLLSFAGTMDVSSACASAEKIAALVCTKK